MPGYERTLSLAARPARVFNAIGNLEGLRSWWTTIVDGSAAAGDELLFKFDGLDEHIRMQVEAARRSSHVQWTCLEHTGAPSWGGTTLTFDLAPAATTDGCELRFRHAGLAAETVATGWDRFLTSRTSHRAARDRPRLSPRLDKRRVPTSRPISLGEARDRCPAQQLRARSNS